MTSIASESKPYISPFSLQHENNLKWQCMTSKEIPLKNGMLDVPPSMMELLKDLAVFGVIGSDQCKRLYIRSDGAKKISKALALGLLKKHELVRGKQLIPLYTLGPTGMALADLEYTEKANYWEAYSVQDVMQRLVFVQLYGQMKHLGKIKVHDSHDPFVASLRITGHNSTEQDFHVLVIRGNESIVTNYFRYETPPERMIVLAEGQNHLKPINEAMKPFADRIRLTTDDRLKMPFEDMFYYFKNNNWILENS